MNTISTKHTTQIYYKDWGSGQPVVFSHRWPLCVDAFEDQMSYLTSRGYRCIAHDRRGHGRSNSGLNPTSIRLCIAAAYRYVRPQENHSNKVGGLI